MKFAEAVLHELEREPCSRTNLEKRVARKMVSHACFNGILCFLVDDGDVEKCGVEHLAPFRITEKGKAFLAWRICDE